MANLKALAGALGVPTTASANDIRLMIGDKVEEMGKDQQNVEVVLDDPVPDANQYSRLSLHDEEGVFLNCELLAHGGADPRPSEPDSDQDGDQTGRVGQMLRRCRSARDFWERWRSVRDFGRDGGVSAAGRGCP